MISVKRCLPVGGTAYALLESNIDDQFVMSILNKASEVPYEKTDCRFFNVVGIAFAFSKELRYSFLFNTPAVLVNAVVMFFLSNRPKKMMTMK